MDLTKKKLYNNGLLYAGFNQDQSCFCVGTETGFRIYNSDPVRCQERQDWGTEADTEEGGGVRFAEMLFRFVICEHRIRVRSDEVIPGVTI